MDFKIFHSNFKGQYFKVFLKSLTLVGFLFENMYKGLSCESKCEKCISLDLKLRKSLCLNQMDKFCVCGVYVGCVWGVGGVWVSSKADGSKLSSI